MRVLLFVITVKERLDDGSWRHETLRGLESSGLAWAHVARIAASGRRWLLTCTVSVERAADTSNPLSVFGRLGYLTYFRAHSYQVVGYEAGRDDDLVAEVLTFEIDR